MNDRQEAAESPPGASDETTRASVTTPEPAFVPASMATGGTASTSTEQGATANAKTNPTEAREVWADAVFAWLARERMGAPDRPWELGAVPVLRRVGRRGLATLAVLVGLCGCTDGLRGVRMAAPPTSRVVAVARPGEPEGLLVLWNDLSDRSDKKRQAWIAGSPDELAAVWSAAGGGRQPRVDFRRYVVIAFADLGGTCPKRPLGIVAEESGRLELLYSGKRTFIGCNYGTEPIARIIAVPRRILTATVVFLDGYAFQVPEVPFE